MNLRNICWYGIFALMLIFVGGATAWAEAAAPAGITTNLDLAYVTKYVWRGLVLNDDPALQPSLTLTHPNGLSLNFWGSLDTTNIVGEKGNITEVDYTLNYERCVGKADLNTGVGYFTYPNVGADPTGEVYVNACFGGDWSPSLAVNYDFKAVNGAYLNFGLGRDCKLAYGKGNPMTLGLSAKVGYGLAHYNEGYFGVDKATFNDVLLSASLPLKVDDKLTITPSLSYATFLDNEIKQSARAQGSSTSNWFGGVTASYAF